MATEAKRIVPVVLSGGAGTRLWPMSREEYPKQLLPLAGAFSMIRETLLRFADATRFAEPIIVTNETLRFAVAEQVRLSGLGGALVLEPVARNTAPAVAASAVLALEADPEAVILVVPSDHVIKDVPAFLSHVAQAEPAARAGHLVTFSIVPTRPETGYGYIRSGVPLGDHPGVSAVGAFVEKPNRQRAEEFLAAGGYFWNSGMFLMSAESYLAELERHAPAILAAVRAAVAARRVDFDFIRLDPESFAASPSISIDYAVMERTDKAATIACDIGWTDVGAWSELWNIAEKDGEGNVIKGDVVIDGVRNSYLRSEGMLTAVVGVENLIVVVTDDAVLVTSRDNPQGLRPVIEKMRREGRGELIVHSRVYRPWGYFQSLHSGDRFQVKRLTINPGARISLQKHYHRAEHWVVVNGTALITHGSDSQILRENESLYIPAGVLHRLENPGKVPLNVIEVRSGGYLAEDDVVRIEDSYGRV